MKQTYSLQSQQHKRRPSARASGSFAEPTRLFASVTSPSEPPLPHERPERPEHTAQFRHSLDRILIRPPVPDRDSGYQVEPSGTQQIGAESSSVQREETGEQAESQKGEALQKVAAPSQAPQNQAGLPDTEQQEATERQAGAQEGGALQKMAAPNQTPQNQTGLSEAAQQEEPGEEAESQEGEALQKVAAPSPAPQNQTGLPDTLKAGVESLSGLSLDNVRVHYHSTKPAQVDALAYTQGTEIHVGPGQEQHLPHEAWHVVQQIQGRVRPTLQMKGVAINDDQGLEKEADVMGVKVSNLTSSQMLSMPPSKKGEIIPTGSIQRRIGFEYQLTNSRVTPNQGLTKGAAIGAKQDGVSPTVDINQSDEYELEFVSDPFDETNKIGWQDLVRAIRRTSNTIKRLQKATSREPRLVSQVLDGGIPNYDIQVPDQVGPLHITGGIQLDNLQTFLVGFSNKARKSTPNPNGPLATLVPNVVGRATARLAALQAQQGLNFSAGLQDEIFSLISLLASTMRYLRGGAPYFKAFYRLLNRTDMATQVAYVRTKMNRELSDGGHPGLDPLQNLIMTSLHLELNLNERLLPQRPGRGIDPTLDQNWNASQLGTLTRRRWLQDLFNGDDPLSIVWQGQQVLAGTAGAQEAVDILESVASLGASMDPSTTSIRPIFEIRDIPRMVTLAHFERWAIRVSKYIMAVNAGTDQTFTPPRDSNLIMRLWPFLPTTVVSKLKNS